VSRLAYHGATMNMEVEETGPVERKLRIEIPTADVDAAFDRVFRELGRTSHLRGFRKGKAPRTVLERTFGPRARGEVLEKLVQDTLFRAIHDAELSVVGEPRLQPEGEPKQGAPYAYEATVEIRPEIELKAVRGLEVEVPPAPALPSGQGSGEESAEADPDADPNPVGEYLEQMRNAHAQLVAEPEGTQSARGHVAVIDYDATVEGEPFEGGTGRETEIELGAGRAIGGFEDELLGLEPDAEREFDLELPEGYPNEKVAGKSAHFRVKLLEIKLKELPELDDEFAKDVSDFESLEELRADLARRLQEGRAAERERRVREALLDKLIDLNPFPVPPSLVERQLQSRIARALQPLRDRAPTDELRAAVERWREEWRPAAERDVRIGLLLPEIAREEAIEVSDEDVDARLREEAESQQRSLTELRRLYKQEGLLEALSARLLEDRVVEFLVSQATLSDS
jgi:trigger factor